MKKIGFIFALLVFVLFIFSTGCTKQEPFQTGSKQSSGQKTVGLLIPTIKIEFWASVADGLQKIMKESGHKLILASYEGDSSKALESIENFIIQKVDVITDFMTDSSADDGFKRAMDSGIAVFAFGAEQTYYNYIMLTDDTEIGVKIAEMAADFINKKHNGKCQIGAIVSYTNSNMAKRSDALLSTLKKLVPASEIVMTANIYDTAGEGMAFTENLLQKFPDCKVVVSYGDAMGVEAMEVFKAAGKAGDGIAIYGCDATRQSILSIKNGDIFRGTISYGEIVQQLAGYLNQLLKGELEEGVYHPQLIRVTEENIDDFL